MFRIWKNYHSPSDWGYQVEQTSCQYGINFTHITHHRDLDKIINERIRGTTKVGEIIKKVQERRLKWYGHVMRREEHYIYRKEGDGNEGTGEKEDRKT